MPKILPFFGALLTLSAAIGWNIVRYPVVWQMVGPATDFPSLASTPLSAIPVQPTQTEEENPAPEPALKVKSEAPLAATEPATTENRVVSAGSANPPKEEVESRSLLAISAAEYAAARGAGCQPAPQNSQPAPLSNLPVSHEIPASSSGLLRRLPPITTEVPPAFRPDTAAYPPGSIPLYPCTGL
jgi:cytoskeletal protein RodZ